MRASLDTVTGAVGERGPSRVRIRGWGWRYAGRKRWACRGVDLDIDAGERVLLVGSSGAGKSTLLRAVAGLLDPETAAEHEGSVTVDGEPAAQARDRVGVLLQDPEASLVMSRAGDDVAFGLENAGVPREEIWPRVESALRRVGFGYQLSRSTAELSGGEQQRLALAGALVRRPSLMVLDEPTANLDPAGTELVLDAVRATTDSASTTLLIVEHRVDVAAGLVDRVVVLEPGGGVVADGSPDDVFARHGSALSDDGVWVPRRWAPAPPRRTPGPSGVIRLRAGGVSRTYRRAAAPSLDVTDLELREGEATCVLGPNGSGKSTLATILAGLSRPDTGGVFLAADPRRPLHRWRARRLCRSIGMVFQDPEHQFLAPTVRSELLIGPRRAGIPTAAAEQRCDYLLTRLHLDGLAGANPYTLSGGEKRRLSVATALATAPDVVVLDEPTFGQDARTWRELVRLCAQLRDDGATLVSVTHDAAFADALADQHVTMRGGRITDVRARPADDEAHRHGGTTTRPATGTHSSPSAAARAVPRGTGSEL
ncbi:ABC transporter ATP-binding protein [Phytoactinopolyspora alkaliphila]|uniref:ABC transporter ATP-binding protein n=1 Tax=Phytoactinopolyspora alkaliphila TaxID=1783498 RepID=UPI0031B60030